MRKKINQKVRNFNKQYDEWRTKYPNCKTWWNPNTEVTEVYICDESTDFPKVIGYIKDY